MMVLPPSVLDFLRSTAKLGLACCNRPNTRGTDYSFAESRLDRRLSASVAITAKGQRQNSNEYRRFDASHPFLKFLRQKYVSRVTRNIQSFTNDAPVLIYDLMSIGLFSLC